MTIAEGGGRRAVSHKLRDMYLPTLKANFMVWPLVQMINFRLMPLQFQLVSIYKSLHLFCMLMFITALRIISWYCLDGVSFFDERC
jgi:hypothetical protein